MKKISSKRNKTETDLEEMAHLEFLGSLYMDNGNPVIPGEVMEATLREGAKKNKKGKDFTRALRCPENFPLIFDGPKEPEKLWKEEKFRFAKLVKVQKNKVLRMRVKFDEWASEILIQYDESVLDEKDIESAMKEAGDRSLLMDWAGRYGAFTFERL